MIRSYSDLFLAGVIIGMGVKIGERIGYELYQTYDLRYN